MAKRLRQADIAELEAAGTNPLEALTKGFFMSEQPRTLVHGTEPVGMFGIVPQLDFSGVIWFLGSPRIKRITKFFLRQSKDYLRENKPKYRRLWNVVHTSNTAHIRWIRWAGFQFCQQYIYNNNTFLEFQILCADPPQSPSLA